MAGTPAPPSASGMSKIAGSAIEALKPYGPTPIVTVTIGSLGLFALSVGAPQLATVGIVLVSFGVYIFGQERKGVWARKELEAQYDGIEQHETRDARIRLERRLNLVSNPVQTIAGDEQGVIQ